MHKTICVPDFERSPRTVLDEVVQDKVPYVLTEESRPEAVIVPYDEFLKFQGLQEADVLARFREVKAEMEERNSCFSDEEIERDVEAVLSKTAR